MLILKDEYLEHQKMNDSVRIYNKFKQQNLEVNVFAIDAGFHFSLRSPVDSHGYDVYTVAKGALRQVSTNRILKVRDTIILKADFPYMALESLEDTELFVVSHGTSPFNETLRKFAFYDKAMDDLQKKDDYTNHHCLRVMELAKKMLPYLNLSDQDTYALIKAARYHDLGKLEISNDILNKPGKLSDQEYDIMKSHVIMSESLLKSDYEPLILNTIKEHHERLDGSGYPLGLKGDAISDLGKILALLDTYDAMTSDRIYKKGKNKNEALKELYDLAGIHYEEKYIKLLENLLHD